MTLNTTVLELKKSDTSRHAETGLGICEQESVQVRSIHARPFAILNEVPMHVDALLTGLFADSFRVLFDMDDGSAALEHIQISFSRALNLE